MLLNILLLVSIIIALLFLIRQLRKKPIVEKIPECYFTITDLKYKIEESVRIAKYRVYSHNTNRYFRDFPIGFKFFSTEKFRSKIKITYVVSGDDEVEIIYDRIVEFEDNKSEHIYYINDVIIGSIDIEIYTDSQYGKPKIEFEILQNNKCRITKEYKLLIDFPE